MKTYSLLLITALQLTCIAGSAQLLTPDTTFWQLEGTGHCVVEDTLADRILVGGDFDRVLPPHPVPHGVELSATTGFMTAGLPAANRAVRCAIPDGSGGWLLGGDFTMMGTVAREHLAHILPDGSLGAWSPGVNGSVFTMAMKGDTVYVGGGFTSVNAAARSNLAAVRLTTGANVTWTAGSANDTVRCMSINSGRLYVGGDFSQMNGAARGRVASFTISTHGLTTWAPTFNNTVYCLLATASAVYVGGEFTLVNLLTTRNRAAALAPTTTTVQAWNPNANGAVRAMVPSGTTIFIGGDFTTVSGSARNHIALLNATGSLNSWSRALDGAVHCLAIANNTVYAGGDFTMADETGRQRLVAFGVPGSGVPTITGWSPAVDSTALTIAIDGSELYAGGLFEQGGGLSRRNTAAFDLGTGLPLPWDPQVNGTVFAVTRVGSGNVFIGGEFTQVGAVAHPYLAAVDAFTGEGLSWNAQAAGGAVNALRSMGDTLIACGAFTSIGGQARMHLALLSASSAAALPWNVPLAATDAPDNMLLNNDTLFVGGTISSVGGLQRRAVASIHIPSSTVLPFSVDCSYGSAARRLCRIGNRLYCGLTTGSWAGVDPDHSVVVLDANTGGVLPMDMLLDPFFTVGLVERGGRLYAGNLNMRVYDVATGWQTAGSSWADKSKSMLITKSGDLVGVGSSFFPPKGLIRVRATPNLSIRVMLDGPFSAGLMNAQLRLQDLIPSTEPFTALGYAHSGGGGGEQALYDPNNVSIGPTTEGYLVDWVLVEYRQASDPSVVVASMSAFVQRNGWVRSHRMAYLPTFDPDPNGSYYVAVRHRNHLGVMTAQPVDFSKSPLIDFSAIATPVYGNNARKTNDGFGTLRSGDVNFDHTLKYTGSNNDRDPILVRIGGTTPNNTTTGYFQEDVNMDGVVKYTGAENDRDPILVNVGGTAPNNVREEQLP